MCVGRLRLLSLTRKSANTDVRRLSAPWIRRALGPRCAPMILRPSDRADLTTGLLARWTFAGGSGSTVADLGPAGKTITLVGSPTWADNYVAWNGSSQNGNVAGLVTHSGATKIALSVWLYPTASQVGFIFATSTSTAANTRFGVYLDASRMPVIAWRPAAADPSGSAVTVTGTVALALNAWSCLNVNWDADADTIAAWVGTAQSIDYATAFTALGTSTTARTRVGVSLATTPASYLAARQGLTMRVFSGRLLSVMDRAALLAEGPPV
jgi:hypothetical protein